MSNSISGGGTQMGDTVNWDIGSIDVAGSRQYTFAVDIPTDFAASGEGRYMYSTATITSNETLSPAGITVSVLVLAYHDVYLPLVLK